MVELEIINGQPFLKVNNKDSVTNWSLVKKEDELLVVSLEEERVDLFSFNDVIQDLNDIEDTFSHEEFKDAVNNEEIEVVNSSYNTLQKSIKLNQKFSN